MSLSKFCLLSVLYIYIYISQPNSTALMRPERPKRSDCLQLCYIYEPEHAKRDLMAIFIKTEIFGGSDGQTIKE